ncbi:phage tail protein, partial [Arsenophonus nasoniae]|uniref:phage tail protein n=1 Tax=Arsenophonus nasoniae TaxID=638 RepID=UPI003879BD1A
DVISQLGVTKALETKQPMGDYVTQLAFNKGLTNKIDKTQLVGTTGNSPDKVLSQKACDDNYAKKNSQEGFTTGGVIIKYGNPTLKFQTTRDNSYSIFELDPDKKILKLNNRNSDNTLKNSVSFPNKNGTLALTADVDAINNYPVGAPIPWPHETAPAGYLICNGQTFTKADYPQLALAYPSGRLPILYGEFIRGLDLGGKVDPGRKILTNQGDAIRNMRGSYVQRAGSDQADNVIYPNIINAKGVFRSVLNKTSGFHTLGIVKPTAEEMVNFDASFEVPTANENRPRNVAFLYIVRAA